MEPCPASWTQLEGTSDLCWWAGNACLSENTEKNVITTHFRFCNCYQEVGHNSVFFNVLRHGERCRGVHRLPAPLGGLAQSQVRSEKAPSFPLPAGSWASHFSSSVSPASPYSGSNSTREFENRFIWWRKWNTPSYFSAYKWKVT